jgi:hypothetical protein
MKRIYFVTAGVLQESKYFVTARVMDAKTAKRGGATDEGISIRPIESPPPFRKGCRSCKEN